MAANYKDVLPSQSGWLHELANAEIHPDAEKILQLGRSFDPQQLVEESTIDFLTELRECFTEFARVLNAYSDNGTRFQEVKIYSLAQTAADFMIFRNQIKLVVSNIAHGVIQLSFAQHLRGNLAVDGQMRGVEESNTQGVFPQAQELIAQLGPFREVYWTFQGEKVTPDQVGKFYFAEFVRATRNTKVSRGNNQVLLEQIKALLNEKGINL